jgi:hypothetical protein
MQLRLGDVLIGRLLIPTCRDRVVLRYTPAVFVHEPEMQLRVGVALICKGPEQWDRGRIVTALIRS